MGAASKNLNLICPTTALLPSLSTSEHLLGQACLSPVNAENTGSVAIWPQLLRDEWFAASRGQDHHGGRRPGQHEGAKRNSRTQRASPGYQDAQAPQPA